MKETSNNLEAIISAEEEKERRRFSIVAGHIDAGVIFVDWKAAYIDEDVVIGKGTIIEPGVIIQGKSTIGKACLIGSNTKIIDSHLADSVKILSSQVVESRIGEGSTIGPFANLRPNSQIGRNCRVGDFVEIKNSTIGDGAKVSHLTYVGDGDVGERANLGCGVVFVNYNGFEKNRTVVKEDAFIGCNVNLIAPVTVEKEGYVAAGTTLTKDVPEGALSVGRVKAEIIPDWVKRRKGRKK